VDSFIIYVFRDTVNVGDISATDVDFMEAVSRMLREAGYIVRIRKAQPMTDFEPGEPLC
jgi:hypothetical protein